MDLSFWARTSGTWINALTVLLGTALGLGLRGRLPVRMQAIIMQGVGLTTLFLGFTIAASLNKAKAGHVDGVVLGLLTIVIGGLLGEWWRLEERLEGLGEAIKRRVRGGGRFTEGFEAASLLFCVGPLTLLGSLTNGLTGDNNLLVVKATLDGLAAIALASSFGIGVGFSIGIILLYQGSVSLAAAALTTVISDPNTDPRVLLVTGIGGLMILGLGINLLELRRIRVASFLPALALAPLAYWVATLFI